MELVFCAIVSQYRSNLRIYQDFFSGNKELSEKQP